MTDTVHIHADWKSLNHVHEELCGDRVMIRRDDKSFVMVLADGLGSGVKANILSTLTSTIISEMVFSGMDLTEAVETITATLPVCQDREVAYSTFNIIQIFYDGRAAVVQYDSPNAVFIRGFSLYHPEEEHIEVSGKPLTIYHMNLQPDDYIIMFSDGILYAGTEMELNLGWGQKEVEEFLASEIRPGDSPGEVARILLANVNALYGGAPGDDSTVACVHAIPASETYVMIGPPKDKEADQEVVRRLLSATGKKICCGGTTASVVGRFIGREAVTDQDSMRPDVPPKAFMDGIDLVTEGLLTLQKVSRWLTKACDDRDFLEELRTSREQDGASCLTRELLEATSVTFLVGLSDNAENNSISSLKDKIALIRDISYCLQKVGVICRIECK